MDKEKLIAFLKGRLFPTPCDSYDDGRDYAYQDVLDEVESGSFDKEVTPCKNVGTADTIFPGEVVTDQENKSK